MEQWLPRLPSLGSIETHQRLLPSDTCPSPNAPIHERRAPSTSPDNSRGLQSATSDQKFAHISPQTRSFSHNASIELSCEWQILGRKELRQECYHISANRPRYTTDSHSVKPKRGPKQGQKSKTKSDDVSAETSKEGYRKKHALAEHDRRLRHKSLLVEQYEETLNDISLKGAEWADQTKAPTKEIILKAMKIQGEMFRWLDMLSEKELERMEQENERIKKAMARREDAVIKIEEAVARREEVVTRREEDVARREKAEELRRKEEELSRREEAVIRREQAVTRREAVTARREAAVTRKEKTEVLCRKEGDLAQREQVSYQKGKIIIWQRGVSTENDRVTEDFRRMSHHPFEEKRRLLEAYQIVDHSPVFCCQDYLSPEINEDGLNQENLACRWKSSNSSPTSAYFSTTCTDKSLLALSESFPSTESDHTKRKWEEGEEAATSVGPLRRAIAKQPPDSNHGRLIFSRSSSCLMGKPF